MSHDGLDGFEDPGSAAETTNDLKSFLANYTFAISPHAVNQFVFQVSDSASLFLPEATDVGIPAVSFNNSVSLGQGSFWPETGFQRKFQFRDDFTWQRGRHLLKFGVQEGLDRITTERRVLSSRLADAKTLNQKILLQKVNGELSPEDFATLKETVTQQTAEVETQLNALDAETSTVQGLLEETQRSIVDLFKAWKNGSVQRQELAFALYPEGLRFSPETLYFEPHNTLLMNSLHEMIDGLLAGKNR